MCISCWEEEGSPAIVNDKVLAAADFLSKLDRYGPWHILVDDWNCSDHNLDFIASKNSDEQDAEGNYVSVVDMDAIAHLRSMTMDERYSALAMMDNIIDRNGQRSIYP